MSMLLPLAPITHNPESRRIARQPLVGGQHEIQQILNALRANRCCQFIGPRYHHKSQIMQTACKQARAERYSALYISLMETTVEPASEFWSSVQQLILVEVKRVYKKSLPEKHPIDNPAALRRFLSQLPADLSNNVALFVDNFDATPSDLFLDLLDVFRATYSSTTAANPDGLMFQVVVCASHNIADLVLAPTSPFYNIADLVTVLDLTPAETEQLVKQMLGADCKRYGRGALSRIYRYTRGDRYLAFKISEYAIKILAGISEHVLTCRVVDLAVEELVQKIEESHLLDGLHHIESDLTLFKAMLQLMQGSTDINKLNLDVHLEPDPLLTSGFVARRGKRYYIKSDLHHRILQRHFSNEHKGRILLAAGEWQQAIDVIGGSIHANHSEGRARVMLPAISAMYSAPSKEIAYNYLAQGLRYAYPFIFVCLYDYDLKRGFLIQQVHRDSDWPQKINAFGHHLVAQALHLKDDDHKTAGTQLLIPLGERDRRVGVVLLSKFFDSQMEHRRHEQVQEVVGYLRHAAQALHYRKEIERLREQEKQYTRRLETVLKAARALMTSSKSFDDVLDQVLSLIQKAFGTKKVQGGSIFLYDRDTGELWMRAQLGYHVPQRKISLKPGRGFAGHVYKRGISVIESDSRTHASTFVDLQGITPAVISAVGTPIFDRQRNCMGVICLDNFNNPGMFSESDKAVLEIFAWQIAPWLENVRLLEVLHNLQKIISELRDLWAKRFYVFAENLAERLVKTFEISGCAIGLRVDKQILFFGVQKGLHFSEKQRESDLPNVLQNKVLRQGKLALIDPTQNGWQHLFGHSAFASLIAIPLEGRKQNHGLILLASRGKFQPSPAESQALLSFAGQLALVLEQARSINYSLTYKPSSLENINRCVDFIRWDKESERPSTEALRSQVTELLRLLFPDARSLWVEQRYQGLSGSVVLRVLPTFKVGPGQDWIVKIGRNDKASREEEHYETYVKNFLPYTHAVKIASHYSRDIGALQYSLANSGSGRTQAFEEFYATESAAVILSGLQRLFNETCKLWYDKAKPTVGNMRNWYEKALELKKNELADYFVQMRSEDELRLPTLAFVGRESRLLNPLRWLNGSPKTMRARVGITHGDLNATNILVSETGEFWLIDFLRTGESHILRDFAILETDIKYRLARHITLLEFYALEEFLLARELAADFESSPEVPKNLKKQASVLLGLRALAHKQLQGTTRDMQREFLTSLSIVTLNVIRLRHFRTNPDLQPQRERALFSAALMVEAIKRLEALG